MNRLVAGLGLGTSVLLGLTASTLLLLGVAGWPGPVWPAAAAVVAALALTAAAHRRDRFAAAGHGPDQAVRVLLAAGVLALAAAPVDAAGAALHPLALATTAVLLSGVLLGEPLLRRLARPWYRAVGLPVRPGPAARLAGGPGLWLVDSAALAATALTVAVARHGVLPDGPVAGLVVAAPALVATLFGGWLAVDGWRRRRTGHREELAALTEALRRHRPRFLLYFSAPPGSAYQVKMWLPHLARLGEPYLLVLAEEHHLPELAAATDAPLVVYDTFEALDAVVGVPGLRAAFYVNNGMKNAHCVRYTHLTHVQLYHGDSDKAVTASPLNAMFDRVFVAGQAAVDRFAAYGVEIPRHKLRLVGRPQVAALEVTDRPVAEVTDPVVLYAPTWAGAYTDVNYCSLPLAETIVGALLARGVTVVLRAHPYAARDRRTAEDLRRAERLLARDRERTGRPHRWGREAREVLSLFDCMNLSHAMICDVSSVASDYLYTGKPMAITDMTGAGARITEEFPVARAAYVVERTGGNLARVLDDLLGADPLAPTRRALRTYYLGDAPPDRYAEVFREEALRVLAEEGEAGPVGRRTTQEAAQR